MRVFQLTFALTFLSGIAFGQDEVEISIHPERLFQKIYGFGASDAWRCQFVGENWPVEKREKIADLLFSRETDEEGKPKGIALSMWRFYIGSGSMEQGDASSIANKWRRAECFQNPDGSYDWNKHQGQRWFLRAAKERGVNQFIAFSISAPVHMTPNGKAFNGSNRYRLNIIPEKLPDYARFLADVVEHFEESEGIGFDYISPVNEPQWLWERATQEGTPATNEDIFELAKHLSNEFLQRKLSTRLLLGEAGDIQYLYKSMNNHGNDRQIASFFADSSRLNVGALPNIHPAITGHSYFTTWPLAKMIAHRQALHDTLKSIDPNLEYWQTEFCILEKNEDIGGGAKRDLGMNTALYFARVIHHDLVLANASSWQFWTALSNADYKDGLVYLDDGGTGVSGHNDPGSKTLQQDGYFRESKTLWALGNYSRFIRPGMRRIGVEYANPALSLEKIAKNLMVSAFTGGDDLVLVAVNYSNEEKLLKVRNHDTFKGDSVRAFVTSEDKDLEPSMSTPNGIPVPARSVVTIVGGL